MAPQGRRDAAPPPPGWPAGHLRGEAAATASAVPAGRGAFSGGLGPLPLGKRKPFKGRPEGAAGRRRRGESPAQAAWGEGVLGASPPSPPEGRSKGGWGAAPGSWALGRGGPTSARGPRGGSVARPGPRKSCRGSLKWHRRGVSREPAALGRERVCLLPKDRTKLLGRTAAPKKIWASQVFLKDASPASGCTNLRIVSSTSTALSTTGTTLLLIRIRIRIELALPDSVLFRSRQVAIQFS